MSTVLITGASRGIGLELATQFAARGDKVIAVCRTASAGLKKLGVRVIEGVDVIDPSAIEHLKHVIEGQPIDVLINDAGILKRGGLGQLDYDAMLKQFEVNALGPLRVTEALGDSLKAGAKVAIVTSRMGSIGDNTSGGMYGYRASKAAVNQIGVSLAHDLKPRGVAVALLHPGMVATDMTDGKGISPKDAAAGLIARIDALTLETSGGFWHAEGYKLPW